MSPPNVKASRRLLINAVREVVNESALLATKKDALRRTESVKRLQSVVSSDAGKILIVNQKESGVICSISRSACSSPCNSLVFLANSLLFNTPFLHS